MSGAHEIGAKPRLRGVWHTWAFFGSLAAGTALVASSSRVGAHGVALVYALSVCSLFGVSSLYHRVHWSPRWRAWMRRLDHTMIFVLIAGSYTPFACLAIEEASRGWVLVTVWATVGAALLINLAWQDAPKWIHAVLGIAAGLAGAATFPQILRGTGWACLTLLIIGGAFYVIGAVIYALKRPDPAPRVFGYHEIFHALVVLAAAVHYAAIALYVMPLAA